MRGMRATTAPIMNRLRRLIPKRQVQIELFLLFITFVLGVYLAAGNVLVAAEYPSKQRRRSGTPE